MESSRGSTFVPGWLGTGPHRSLSLSPTKTVGLLQGETSHPQEVGDSLMQSSTDLDRKVYKLSQWRLSVATSIRLKREGNDPGPASFWNITVANLVTFGRLQNCVLFIYHNIRGKRVLSPTQNVSSRGEGNGL